MSNPNQSLDEKTTRKIAHLARIGITDEQVKTFEQDLNKILNTISELSQLNTDDTTPMMHPLDLTQDLTQNQEDTEHYRQDEVTENIGIGENIKNNAPESDQDLLFLTPKVIK